MPIFDLIYFGAAAWYIAYVLTSTHGPFQIFDRIREWRGGRWHGRSKPFKGVIHEPGDPPTTLVLSETKIKDGLLDCVICVMIWGALILHSLGHNLITDGLAIAGVALWIHGFTGWRHNF